MFIAKHVFEDKLQESSGNTSPHTYFVCSFEQVFWTKWTDRNFIFVMKYAAKNIFLFPVTIFLFPISKIKYNYLQLADKPHRAADQSAIPIWKECDSKCTRGTPEAETTDHMMPVNWN